MAAIHEAPDFESDTRNDRECDTPPAEIFSAPSDRYAIDHLITDYQRMKTAVLGIADFMRSDDMTRAAGFYFEANRRMFERYVPEPAKVFDPEYGLKALNAHYWQRALEQTDLFDVMPDQRRQEWEEQIHRMDTPAFEERTVRDNIDYLLNQRMQFLAEKFDGIFRNLSGAHVTNRPEGFTQRMIVAKVFSEFGTMGFCFGYIHDMRGVLAKLMGRDQPG